MRDQPPTKTGARGADAGFVFPSRFRTSRLLFWLPGVADTPGTAIESDTAEQHGLVLG